MNRPPSPFLPIINSPSVVSVGTPKASRPSSPFASEVPSFLRSPLRPRKFDSDQSVATNSVWESEASVCIGKGRYGAAIDCLSKAINGGDMQPRVQTYFNRSVCYEKLGQFGPALHDALLLFRQAENMNKLQLKHFRRLATCQMNCNLFHDAHNTLVQSDLYESKIATISSYLSNSTLMNERVKLADLRRDLAGLMRKGTKKTKNPIFGSLSPAVASQLAPRGMSSASSFSLYSDIQGSEDKFDFLEEDQATKDANEMKDLVKAMTIWDARADMKKVRRDTKKQRDENEKVMARQERSQRKIVHSFESLSRMSSKASTSKLKEQTTKFKTSASSKTLLSANGSARGSPFSGNSSAGSPGQESPENSPSKKKKQRCPFPVATALTKGTYKKTEFPRYVRFHSQYHKKDKKRVSHLRKTMQHLQQTQANSHEKYVFKDKMQLCKLVSVLGRDNTELSRYLTEDHEIAEDYFSESDSEFSDDSEYDSEFDESDWDDSRPTTTASNRSRASRVMSHHSTRRSSSRPGTNESAGSTGSTGRPMPSTKFAMLGKGKSAAIMAIDAKMEEHSFDGFEDGRVKFPGLLS